MELTTEWQVISTTEIMVQKHGTVDVLLAYSAVSPAPTDPKYTLIHNEASIFPDQLGDKDLWARAKSGTAHITLVELDTLDEVTGGAFDSGFDSGFEI